MRKVPLTVGGIILFLIIVISTVYVLKTTTDNRNYITLTSFDNNNIEYPIYRKKIFVFTVECDKCISDLLWLESQPKNKQKEIDLISLSSLNDTIDTMKKMTISSKIYVDTKKEFTKRYKVKATPTVFIYDGEKLIEIEDGLKKLIK
ncbi:MAG: hypothetical protein BWY74_01323 [Firmicutes bacterium ADurb.Bin419]|nr:MAG: hypothetical protein BWY74_01323 [Firmicutes bacterium ADurb.Bin419]